MGEWIQEFLSGLVEVFHDIPSGRQVGEIVVRMLVAAVLGGVLGYERGQSGKAAGMRTHMLVALAAAFLLAVAQQSGFNANEMSRVVQGLAAGVGFLGAGTILKLSDQGKIVGLTTAASIYFTTAIGVAAGMGKETTAILGTVLALAVLVFVPQVEDFANRRPSQQDGGEERRPAKPK